MRIPKKGMFLARSIPREASSFHGTLYFEYLLSEFNVDDFMEMRRSGKIGDLECYAKYRIDQRRVDKLDGSPNEIAHEWQLWAYEDSPTKVIEEVIGDTQFQNAESLSDMHAKAVSKLRAQIETNRIAREKQKRLEQLCTDREEIRRTANREWVESQVKWAGNAKRIGASKIRITNKHKPELDRLTLEISALTK